MSRRYSDPKPPCGKRKLSESKAQGAVKKARRSGLEHRKEQRVYFCKGCQAFHTTSSPFTTAAERRAKREAA